MGGSKLKSVTVQEWHHLLDIHLLKPHTVCFPSSKLYTVHVTNQWDTTTGCKWFQCNGGGAYMVRSRGLLWKAPSGIEAMSLL